MAVAADAHFEEERVTRPQASLPALSEHELATVTGGRLIPSKQPSADMIRNLQAFAESAIAVSQQIAASKGAREQQMAQVFQNLFAQQRSRSG
jgi:hypothetical protein